MVTRAFLRTLGVASLVALSAHADPPPAPAGAPAAPKAAPPAAAAAQKPPASVAAPAPPAPTPPVVLEEEAEPSQPSQPAGAAPFPRLHHAPRAVAPTHTALEIPAEIDFPHLVRRAVVAYRPLPAFGYPASSEFSEAEFLRGAPGPYVATIPAEAVRAPGLEYAIELELVDGRKVPAFASRAAPHSVLVSEDLMDVREHAALERLGGRRSVVSTFAEFVSFGPTTTNNGTTVVPDKYYQVEAAYTYRLLRTIDEFTFHTGVMRGISPVPGTIDPSCATFPTCNDRKVGWYYAAASVKLRIADLWRIDVKLLTGLTEVKFSGGGGGAVEVGDPYGSKLRIGFESIAIVGTRFFSQVDIQASPHLRLSPIIEATDMPHADRFGVRLIGEALYDVGNGFLVGVRGGYQARDSTSGGPSAGLRLGYAF
jgi:hypothetical protein